MPQAREAAGLFGAVPAARSVRAAPQINPRLQQPPRPPLRPHRAPKQVGKDAGKQAEKKEPPPPPGPHMLIVSVKSQRVTLYANGKQVAQSPVSTGTAPASDSAWRVQHHPAQPASPLQYL